MIEPARGEQPQSDNVVYIAARRRIEQDDAYSDLAYSKDLAAANEDKLIHVAGRGWLSWTGKRWAESTDDAIRAAKELAHAGVVAAVEANADAKYQRLAIGRCSEQKIRACLKLAESDERLSCAASHLDTDPELLNTHNGVVDLATGELKEHQPALYMTKIAGADYEPGEHSERWARFLAEACGDDPQLVAYVQRLAGYAATGFASEEIVAFFHGPGGTGKTTLIEALRAALGDYAAVADFASFLGSRSDGSAASPDIASLPGVRLACASEVAPNQHFNTSRLKSLTGGERITARRLYRDPFEFQPQFTLVLAANDRPSIPANDTAAWRRMRLVPFDKVIPPADRDPDLKRSLTTEPDERAAVLAWIVAGAVAWHQRGLGTCAAVEAATRGYRTENDQIGTWLDTCCERAADASTLGSELRANYEQWCIEASEQPCSGRALAAALREHGFSDKHTKTGNAWTGVRLAHGEPSEAIEASDQDSATRTRVGKSPEQASIASLGSPATVEDGAP